MKVERFGIYWVDFGARQGTEPGKIRPAVVVQTDFLNPFHPSTVVCPITSRVVPGASLLRVRLSKDESGLAKESDILVDQIKAVDIRRLKSKAGRLPQHAKTQLLENLRALIVD